MQIWWFLTYRISATINCIKTAPNIQQLLASTLFPQMMFSLTMFTIISESRDPIKDIYTDIEKQIKGNCKINQSALTATFNHLFVYDMVWTMNRPCLCGLTSIFDNHWSNWPTPAKEANEGKKTFWSSVSTVCVCVEKSVRTFKIKKCFRLCERYCCCFFLLAHTIDVLININNLC